MNEQLNSPANDRMVSLDAYRGFVMLAMVSGGFALGGLAKQFPESKLWKVVEYQLEHVEWSGCSAWDLIQPSFTFIVGVAMPFSLASRLARGDSKTSIWLHTLWRAFLLVAIGIFLRSNGHKHTNFTFEDVTTQIGLGYALVFLLLGTGLRIQIPALLFVLAGYWAFFALWPLPPETFDPAKAGIPNDWSQFTGFAAHWNKYMNPAGYFDQWFLNLFPREKPFVYNGGGYQTLSFIPSMATMIFGVLTGEMLRKSWSLWTKFALLVVAGLLCLAIGMAVDKHIWPNLRQIPTEWVPNWSYAPIVKRIWTPSWAVFSTGWTLLALAAFVLVIDIFKFRIWAFPFVVVGMNSIAIYVMSWLFKSWIKQTLHTHFGDKPFDGIYGPVVLSVATVFVLWLICLWMYRRRVFLRI